MDSSSLRECYRCGSLCEQGPQVVTGNPTLATVPPLGQTLVAGGVNYFQLPQIFSSCLKSFSVVGPPECYASRSLLSTMEVSLGRECPDNGFIGISIGQVTGIVGEESSNLYLGNGYRTCDLDVLFVSFTLTNLGCSAIGEAITFNVEYSSFCTGGVKYYDDISLVDIFQSDRLVMSFPYRVHGGTLIPQGADLNIDCNGVQGLLNSFIVEESDDDEEIVIRYTLSPVPLKTLYNPPLCLIGCGENILDIHRSCWIEENTVYYHIPGPFGPTDSCTNFNVFIQYRYSLIGEEVNLCYQCDPSSTGSSCISDTLFKSNSLFKSNQ